MPKVKKKMLPMLVTTLAIIALAVTPALAKGSQNKKFSHSSVKAAAEAASHVSEQSEAQKIDHQDSNPGPAWDGSHQAPNPAALTPARFVRWSEHHV